MAFLDIFSGNDIAHLSTVVVDDKQEMFVQI